MYSKPTCTISVLIAVVFNLDPLSEFLNGVQVSIVELENHLGNYVSPNTNINDRNIIANVCDLYFLNLYIQHLLSVLFTNKYALMRY